MYIPVRSAGDGLAYKMPFIPMNALTHGAVGPFCVQKLARFPSRCFPGEIVVSHLENALCRLNQIHIHAQSPKNERDSIRWPKEFPSNEKSPQFCLTEFVNSLKMVVFV